MIDFDHPILKFLSEPLVLAGLTVVGTLVGIATDRLIKARAKRELARTVNFDFEKGEVKAARTRFIPMSILLKEKLSSLFVKKGVFSHRNLISSMIEGLDVPKIVIIVGGTGIGKSTFLIRAYLSFNTYWRYVRAAFGQKEVLNTIVAWKLNNDKVIKKIRKLNEKMETSPGTILLLDGIDEMPEELGKTFSDRVHLIKSITENLGGVIMTCRNQFASADELNDACKQRKEGKNAYVTNKKVGVYTVLPLTNKQVEGYITDVYPWYTFQSGRRKIARLLLKEGSIASDRIGIPLMLFHLREILSGKKYNSMEDNPASILEKIVDQWLMREAGKVVKDGNEQQFQDNLLASASKVGFQMVSVYGTDYTEVYDPVLADRKVDNLSLMYRSYHKHSNRDILRFSSRVFRDYFAANYAKQQWYSGLKSIALERDFFKNAFAEELFQVLSKGQCPLAVPLASLPGGEVSLNAYDLRKVSKFLISKAPLTVGDFKRYIKHQSDKGVPVILNKGSWFWQRRNQKRPSFNFKVDADYTYGPYYDKKSIRLGSSEDEHPVVNVGFREAVDFCNYLSDLAKLNRCYSFEGNLIKLDVRTNGYRLPFLSELDFCQSVALNDERRMEKNLTDTPSIAKKSIPNDNFDLNMANSLGINTHPVRQNIPASYDLFDLIGNVANWTWSDQANMNIAPKEIRLDEDFRLIVAGESLFDSSFETHRTGFKGGKGFSHVGIRIVRNTPNLKPIVSYEITPSKK